MTPSPKPFSEDGSPLTIMEEDEYTLDIRRVAAYAKRIGEAILDRPIYVKIARDRDWPFRACFGDGELTLNYSRLGKKWFANGASHQVNELLIHEFAHHYASSHLSKEFYDACCKVGARLADLARFNPELFKHDD